MNARAPVTKYDFLLALEVGEPYTFENKPTLSEARRKVSPSLRTSYARISSALGRLRRFHPDHHFRLALSESTGSRISGDLAVVTLLARGAEVGAEDELRNHEALRQVRLDAWKKRKQAEDAPKLPGQLAEAERAEHGKRVAHAVRAQAIRSTTPLIDPVKLAELAVAHAQGKQIQRLNGVGWVDDPSPTWREPTARYRVKPTLRDLYIVVGRDGAITATAQSVEALPNHDPSCRVHFREVMPEEETA